MVAKNTSQFETAFSRLHRREGRARAPASRPPIARRRSWRRSIRAPGRRTWRGPGHVFPLRGAQRRRAGAGRADRGGGRSRAHRRAVSGRRHLRNHEQGRHDGARAGADAVRQAAQAADDHDRRSDPVPDADRGAGPARGDGGAADRARRVPGHRLREPARRRDARGAGPRRDRRRRRTCWCACTRSA